MIRQRVNDVQLIEAFEQRQSMSGCEMPSIECRLSGARQQHALQSLKPLA
jgi:hypothetical protein